MQPKLKQSTLLHPVHPRNPTEQSCTEQLHKARNPTGNNLPIAITLFWHWSTREWIVAIIERKNVGWKTNLKQCFSSLLPCVSWFACGDNPQSRQPNYQPWRNSARCRWPTAWQSQRVGAISTAFCSRPFGGCIRHCEACKKPPRQENNVRIWVPVHNHKKQKSLTSISSSIILEVSTTLVAANKPTSSPNRNAYGSEPR